MLFCRARGLPHGFCQGRHTSNALAFLIATTNLVLGTGIVLWVLVGWRFVVANFLLGIIMILYAYLLTSLWLPRGLDKKGRKHAEQLEAEELKHPSPEGMNAWQKLTSNAGWQVITMKFFGEWKTAYKEVLIGFTLPVLYSPSCPIASGTCSSSNREHKQAPSGPCCSTRSSRPFWLFTFVGSLGNTPLATILWSKISFGGVMSFLGADLLTANVIYLHAKYYGWAFTVYLSGVLYI